MSPRSTSGFPWILALVTASISYIAWAGTTTVSFAGFLHDSLGNAQLVLEAGRLELSGLGSAGMDGVRVQTVAAEGIASRLGVDPADFPHGGVLTLTARGPVDGRLAIVAHLEIERTFDGYELTPSFSDLGTDSYRLELYLDDVQVLSKSSPMGALTVGWPADIELEVFVHRGGAMVISGFSAAHVGGVVRLPGEEGIPADSVAFVAEAAANDADDLGALDITSNSVSALTIIGHDLIAWDTRHRALEGIFVPGTDSLRLESPTPLAGDFLSNFVGVDVLHGEARSWQVVTEDLSPRELLGGASLEVRTFATVDDVPEQEATGTLLQEMDSELQVSFDFAPLSGEVDPVPYAVPYSLEVLAGGVVVESRLILSGPAVRVTDSPASLESRFPSPFPPDPFPIDQSPADGGLPLLAITFDGAVEISILDSAHVVMGDEIRAQPAFDPKTVTSASRSQLVAIGMPSLVIENEKTGLLEKLQGRLGQNFDLELCNCQDEVRPNQLVNAIVYLDTAGGNTRQNMIRVRARDPLHLKPVDGLNMARDPLGGWQTKNLTLAGNSKCAVGLRGVVAAKATNSVRTDFEVSQFGQNVALHSVYTVKSGSGQTAQPGGIPPDCQMLCEAEAIPQNLQCKEDPYIYSNGFECGDTSKWTRTYCPGCLS